MYAKRQQRYAGKYYTPLAFAEKALESLESVFGADWLQSGQYRLWDMAAGTGNLVRPLPPQALKHCYLSTLDPCEVEELQTNVPDAVSFQYDYLNDGTNRLPLCLQKDLNDPKIQWVILVNPPYATAQDAGLKGKTKNSVAETRIRQAMHQNGLGTLSRELYIQFLYRIQNDFRNKKAHLALFAPLKYLISHNYQQFRTEILRWRFQTGFVFSSENFGGTSSASHFPVSFILWELNGAQTADALPIVLDVLNENAAKTGNKTLCFEDRSQFLSCWVKRPRATLVFPPFSSALTVKEQNKDTRHRIAEGFLASLMCPGNELQCQSKTALLSGPQVSAGAFSVTPENFEQAMVVFAARRVPQNTWLTHIDPFLKPNRPLAADFVLDCVLWSLFDVKNQTVALRNVPYRNKVYQVKNHFFPFSFSDVQRWDVADKRFRAMLENAEDSFIADYLRKRTLSPLLCDVMAAAEAVYRCFFRTLEQLPLSVYKVETCDAGWRQIVLALQCAEHGSEEIAALKALHTSLKEILLKQLHDYGIVG